MAIGTLLAAHIRVFSRGKLRQLAPQAPSRSTMPLRRAVLGIRAPFAHVGAIRSTVVRDLSPRTRSFASAHSLAPQGARLASRAASNRCPRSCAHRAGLLRGHTSSPFCRPHSPGQVYRQYQLVIYYWLVNQRARCNARPRPGS